MEWLTEIGKNLVTPLAVIAGFSWITKQIATQTLSKDIENYKSYLLQKSAEHKVRFENIYSKRAEVTAEIYKLIADANWHIGDYMAPLQMGEEQLFREKAIKSTDAVNSLNIYFLQSAIFFPDDLEQKISNYIKELRSNFIEYDTAQAYQKEDRLELSKTLQRTWKKQTADLKTLNKELKSELRKYLGDE